MLSLTTYSLAQEAVSTKTKAASEITSIIIVEGQITDYVGGGVKDVTIIAYHQSDDDTKGEIIAQTTTDEIGDFSLSVAEEIHGDIIVTLTKATFQPITHHLHIGDDEFPPFIADSLHGTLQLRGSVRSQANDKPVLGAAITLSTGYQDFQATSDAQGKFQLKNLSPGFADLTISAKGFGREKKSIQNIELESEHDIVFMLKPERVINLIVRNELHQPISGVTIELFDQPRDDLQTVVSDSLGKASVNGIHFDAEELRVRLTHDDYVSSIDFDKTITLTKEKIVSQHELSLQRGGKISGTVLDEQGQPLNGARVIAGDMYSDGTPRDWSTYDGSYTIRQIPPGPAVITVHLSDYAPQLKKTHITPGKTTHITFRLKSGVALTGFVRTEDGDPVSRAEIVTTTWHGAQTLGLRTMTNDKGYFVMRGAPLDEFDILARTPAGHKKKLTVSVKDGEPISIIVPTKPPASRAGNGPAIGDDVPAISLTTLDGQSLNLHALKGKTVLIDFWATWCGPCVAELPELESLYKEFRTRDDFVMISISQDFDISTLKRFIKKRKKMAWPQVFDDQTSNSSLAYVFGVEALPTVYIIGSDGKIAANTLRGRAIGNKIHELLEE